MLPFRAAIAALPVFIAGASAQGPSGLTQQYCSSQNTGSDYDGVKDIYQSNGACFNQCVDNYAFAVVQWQHCWCSNYIPADTSSTSDCGEECPGYPRDLCGNRAKGLYGYIKLKKEPSGTAGGGSSSQPSSTQAKSSTSEEQPPPTTSTTTTTSTSSTPPPPPTTTSSSSTPPPAPLPVTTPTSTSETESESDTHTRSATPSPVTSTRVVTVSGSVVTQTVTSTPLVYPSAESSTEKPEKSLSGGAIAGIVLGILLFLAALIFAAFILYRRRRSQTNPHGAPEMARHGSGPKRNHSVLSKAGLLSRTHTDLPDDDSPPNPSARHSFLFPHEGVEASGPLDSGMGRRSSKAMVYDQRLNPSALFANADANGSRVSMQDGADYSRALDGRGGGALKVANPDARASFESRMSEWGR